MDCSPTTTHPGITSHLRRSPPGPGPCPLGEDVGSGLDTAWAGGPQPEERGHDEHTDSQTAWCTLSWPGARVRLRPGDERDVPVLCAILAEPEVACWWGDPEPASVVAAGLRGDDESVLLVVETAGQVIGGIQYHEENDPMYRHAGIDIYLSGRGQGQGLGTEAVALLARFLCEQRGHHRLTIDPAADQPPGYPLL